MEKMRKFGSVDEYMLYLPDDKRIALEKVRQAIQQAAPKAEEYIGYGMPGYKYKWALVYFAAFKNHCSFFVGKNAAKDFAKDLSGFKIVGSTIQFSPDKPIPVSVIKKIVKLRVQENEAIDEMKKATKKKIVKKKKTDY